MTCMCGDIACPSCGTAQGTFIPAPSGFRIEPGDPDIDEETYDVWQDYKDPGCRGRTQSRFLGTVGSIRAANDRIGDYQRGIRYVCVWEVHRCYGGPEEGGWWYDAAELITCETHGCAETAKARLVELEGEYSNEGRRELSSVLSDGRLRVGVQPYPGEDEPKTRPHYE